MEYSKINKGITKPSLMLGIPETYLFLISFAMLPFVAFTQLLYGLITFIALWAIGAILTYIDPYMIMVVIAKFRIRPTHKHANKKGQYYVG